MSGLCLLVTEKDSSRFFHSTCGILLKLCVHCAGKVCSFSNMWVIVLNYLIQLFENETPTLIHFITLWQILLLFYQNNRF